MTRAALFSCLLLLSACSEAIDREPSFTETFSGPYDRIAECSFVKLEAYDSGITVKLTELRSMNEMRISGDANQFRSVNYWYIRFIKANDQRTIVEARIFQSNSAWVDLIRSAAKDCAKSEIAPAFTRNSSSHQRRYSPVLLKRP